jgi:hypothetical protein
MRRLLVAFSLGFMFALINAPTTFAASTPCPYSWGKNLRAGSVGSDVLNLQRFLNTDPSTMIASTGIGSSGQETMSYGGLTAKAVAKFQEKYSSEVLAPAGLTKGTGSVGPVTRAKLNALCTAATAPIAQQADATAQDMLNVTAGDQPKPTLAPAGAGGVPFTSVTLTAGAKDVTVHSVTVGRTGPGMDGAFDSVALTDQGGNQIGDEKHFNSNHHVVFSDSFTVPANTSETFTIVGNMTDDTSNYAGQMPVLQIDSIDASSPVEGVLPIKGTPQVVNDTLIIGGATAMLSSYDPSTNTNRYINDTGIRFSGIRITADSQEDLTLGSITWDQGGTAGGSDLANVVTVVNGAQYPTEVDGRSYTSTFSSGIVIPKGQTIDVYVQGDLTTTGANRTVEFDIDGSDDISLTGNTYGYGVGIAADGNTATDGHSVFITSDGTSDGDEGTPFFSGSVATINAGTVISIQRAN